MKTQKEWLEIYNECWDIIKDNSIRLLLGKMSKDYIWGYIKIIEFPKKTFDMRKILDLCDKYNLRTSSDWQDGSLRLEEIE